MKEKEKPKMVKCPECPREFPEDDIRAQNKHMKRHPEVTAQHLRELGYHQAAERFLRERKVEASLKIK